MPKKTFPTSAKIYARGRRDGVEFAYAVGFPTVIARALNLRSRDTMYVDWVKYGDQDLIVYSPRPPPNLRVILNEKCDPLAVVERLKSRQYITPQLLTEAMELREKFVKARLELEKLIVAWRKALKQ